MLVNITKSAARYTLLLLLLGLIAACDSGREDLDLEEHVLRIHDVSGMQVEALDHKLNILLSREDLPLRGQVELVDDSRLAVNASQKVQREIAGILADLGSAASTGQEMPGRDYRVQFWLVKMSYGAGEHPLPAGLDEVLAPVAEEFSGFGFQIQDFVESYHGEGISYGSIQSGAGSTVAFRRLRVADDGVHATVSFRGIPAVNGSSNRVNYEVDRRLRPGQPLIVGRAHGGGMGEEAVYQVLIARMEWAD